MTALLRATIFTLFAMAWFGKAFALDDGSLEKLLPLAQQSHPEAQYHVGMFYNNGIGGASKDPKKAFDWFLQSAQGGDPLGAYKAGCYLAGQFGAVPINKEQALHWKLLAAKAGYSLAQSDVAVTYAQAKEWGQARYWWRLAADQGYAPAALNLSLALGQEPHADKALAYTYLSIGSRLATQKPTSSTQAYRDTLAAQLSAEQVLEAESAAKLWEPHPTALTLQALQAATRIDTVLASAAKR